MHGPVAADSPRQSSHRRDAWTQTHGADAGENEFEGISRSDMGELTRGGWTAGCSCAGAAIVLRTPNPDRLGRWQFRGSRAEQQQNGGVRRYRLPSCDAGPRRSVHKKRLPKAPFHGSVAGWSQGIQGYGT